MIFLIVNGMPIGCMRDMKQTINVDRRIKILYGGLSYHFFNSLKSNFVIKIVYTQLSMSKLEKSIDKSS